MGKIIEGVWDCTYCGAKKIRGSIYECPVCGRQRDNDISFYIDNPHNYISDEAAEKLNKNPDWLCSYCDALNNDDNETCYECGASREESELNYLELKEKRKQQENESQTIYEAKEDIAPKETVEYEDVYSDSSHDDNTDEIKKKLDLNNDGVVDLDELMSAMSDKMGSHTNSYIPLDAEKKPVNHSYNKPTPEKKNSKGKLKSILTGFGIFMLIVSIIVAGILIFSPKNENVTINSFEWERNIEIEEFRTVNESDWTVPAGGRIKETKQEIKGYQDVIDHYETKTRTYTEEVLDHYETEVIGYEDLGNGHFREQTRQVPVYRTEVRTETYEEPVYRKEPIYATKYYYEIDKWVYLETSKASQPDHSPYWPEKKLDSDQREGKKTEKYTVYVTNEKGDEKTYTMELTEWSTLKIGQKVTLKTYIDGSADIVLED